jgi:hypothetical protein
MNPQPNTDTMDGPSDPLADEASDESDVESATTSSSVGCESVDPLSELLEESESDLNLLTLEAETVVMQQPRATQVALTEQTRKLFAGYEQHGSMTRLKVGIEKYLFDKTDLIFTDGNTHSGTAGRPPHFGKVFMHNETKDDDEQKYEVHEYSTTFTLSPAATLERTLASTHPLRTTSPSTLPYVTTLPWDPVATRVTWPGNLEWPTGLLGRLNQILTVVDHEARVRLFHHISKYGPAPIFRVGIENYLQSHYGSIFESTRDNYLAFSPETRVLLRSVFDSRPRLNRAERRLLARACRIGEESIILFWEDMTEAREAYKAMKVFMLAREVERSQEGRIMAKMDKIEQERLRAADRTPTQTNNVDADVIMTS